MVVVFGATTGATAFLLAPEGASLLFHEAIPWTRERPFLLYWPMDWLKSLVQRVKADAGPEGIVAVCGFGAGIAAVNEANPWDSKIVHYACVPGEGKFYELVLERAGLTKAEVYLGTGGANSSWYMPSSLIALLRENDPRALAGGGPIVPWQDFVRMMLGAGEGHDVICHHDFGFSLEGRRICAQLAGDPSLESRLVPWPTGMSLNQASDGVIVGECTHDTPVVVMTLADGKIAVAVLSSGTWKIVGMLVDVAPTLEMFEAGIAFEGPYGRTYAGSNICAAGPAWKALKGGLSFDEAAALARQTASRHGDVIVNVPEMPMEPAEAIAWLERVTGSSEQGVLLSSLAASSAYWTAERLRRITELTGVPAGKLIGGGGWMLNEYFVSALTTSVEPTPVEAFSYPTETTAWALAARQLVACGDASTLEEALAMLPPPPG